MKMKRLAVITLCAALAVCVLCGCTPKMTTVRPAEISEMTVERLSDGATVTLPNETHDADLKNALIFQLEEPYESAGGCADGDAHAYNVKLFILDKLDTEVIINSDGSVCRNGKRYVASSEADSPVNIADWDALFAEGGKPAETPGQGAQTQDPDGFVAFAAQGTPQPLTDDVDLISSTVCADVAPWSYYVSFSEANSDFVVWRDNPKGDAELLMRVSQTDAADSGLLNSVSYEGGADESGGRYLYFMTNEGASFHSAIWVLDTQTLYFNKMYDAPCSNMVIPLDPPSDYKGMGWIVHESYLIPIELEKAEEYTGGVIDLSENYAALGEELFYGIGDFGTHKFVRLFDIGAATLEIDSVISEPAASGPERVSAHSVDYSTSSFS